MKIKIKIYSRWQRIILMYSIIFLMSAPCHAYTNKKVILLATRDAQRDTIGYNFVNELSAAAFGWINEGRVTLWNSPEKKASLNAADLKGIEKNSGSSFTRPVNIFIYESWSSAARKFSFTVKGFSFTGTDAKGEDVLFGYIEYNSALKDLLKSSTVHLNANGRYGTTLYSALMNMGFQFNLVYFDDGPLQDYKNSARIVQKALKPGKKMVNAVPVPDSKLVEYGWDSTKMEQVKISDQLTKVISDFFNQNKQEFFNYGGDKYYSYLKDKPILFSGFHVIQSWTRDKKGIITYTTLSIVPYTVGIPLQPVPVQKLDEWKLSYNSLPLSEYLTQKDFPYAIKRINETPVPWFFAEKYKNALFAGHWDNILTTN
jgi:hypothetical protein